MTTYVKPSDIDGMGLFAHGNIDIGDGIIIFEGEKSDKWSPHLITLSSGSIEVMNNAKYVNHSPTPNAHVSGNVLFALHWIKAGEEITVDYGSEGWDQL